MNGKRSSGRPARRQARDGSVLMETVIAIPLFLVLIGATLWMGELNLNRQRSLTADRYAAWNRGNRLGGADVSPDGVWQQVFNRDADAAVKRVRVRAKSSGWYSEVSATAHTKVSMPAWTHGMIRSGVTWDVLPMTKQETITGRDGPHLVLMRGGARDQDKADVNWLAVRFDNWWPGIGRRERGGDLGGRMTKQDSYDRFGQFVDWSD